jgi:hypothetical protein
VERVAVVPEHEQRAAPGSVDLEHLQRGPRAVLGPPHRLRARELPGQPGERVGGRVPDGELAVGVAEQRRAAGTRT